MSHRTIIPIPIPKAPAIIIEIDIIEGMVAAAFGATLSVTLVPDVAVHWSPQANPFGQQLPPRLAAQLYHALGQLPSCGAIVASLGAMITTPFVFTSVVLAVGAQEPVV